MKKVKLKDMTLEDMLIFDNYVCNNIKCSTCPFNDVACSNDNVWINHKNLYSDAFLNQEVFLPIDDINLSNHEISFIKDKIKDVEYKVKSICINNNNMLEINFEYTDDILLKTMYPPFKHNEFSLLKKDHQYTLKELHIYD